MSVEIRDYFQKLSFRMLGGTAKDFTSRFMPSEECFKNWREIWKKKMKKSEKKLFLKVNVIKLSCCTKLSSKLKLSWRILHEIIVSILHKSIVFHSLLGLRNWCDFLMKEIKLLECGCRMDDVRDAKDYFVQFFAEISSLIRQILVSIEIIVNNK